MKYLHEEDKKVYLSLLLPNSSVYPPDVSTFRLPGFKIQHVELQYDFVVKEQKSVFEAEVGLYEYKYESDPNLFEHSIGVTPAAVFQYCHID
jgi:hypothetical protein